jgi:hypothetical protein
VGGDDEGVKAEVVGGDVGVNSHAGGALGCEQSIQFTRLSGFETGSSVSCCCRARNADDTLAAETKQMPAGDPQIYEEHFMLTCNLEKPLMNVTDTA